MLVGVRWGAVQIGSGRQCNLPLVECASDQLIWAGFGAKSGVSLRIRVMGIDYHVYFPKANHLLDWMLIWSHGNSEAKRHTLVSVLQL